MLQDGLFVDWRLLEGQNHETPYSRQPDSALREIFDRRKTLELAYQLLALNRPEYIFHFYGGEPTIHPYFTELLEYLNASRRNIKILLDTNGKRGINYYKNIIELAAPNSLWINFHAHLAELNLKDLLFLIALCAEKQQFAHVIINHVPSHDDLSKNICQKLIMLRKTLPFGMEIRLPLGGDAPWHAQALQAFHSASGPVLEIPEWRKIKTKHGKTSEQFGCVGITAAHIDPDGFLSQGLLEDNRAFTPDIRQNAKFISGIPGGPYFEDKESAQKFLADFALRNIRYRIDGIGLKHPLRARLDEEQTFLKEIKYLRPGENNGISISQNPRLLENKTAYAILPLLDGELAKLVYLRRFKAQLFGDGAYLADTPPPPKSVLENGSRTLSPFQTGEWLNLEAEKDPLEALDRALQNSDWFHQDLQIILPKNEVWLDILYMLLTSAPAYEIYLQQRKDLTLAYAIRQNKINFLPVLPYDKDGDPLLSFIVDNDGSGEALARTLEDIINVDIQHYEAIVAISPAQKTIYEIINKFISLSRWKIRPCPVGDMADSRLNLALALSQGAYVYAICGEEAINGGFISQAINILEQEQTDLAISIPGLKAPKLLTQLSDKIDFLQSCAGMENGQGKIYRRSLLKDHALYFEDAPHPLTWTLFNLRACLLAKKIALLPSTILPIDALAHNDQDSPQAFHLLGDIVKAVINFCMANGIALKDGLFDGYLLQIYDAYKSTIAREILRVGYAEYPAFFTENKWLLTLASTPGVMRRICAEAMADESPDYHRSSLVIITDIGISVNGAIYRNNLAESGINFNVSAIVTLNAGFKDALLKQLLHLDPVLIECVLIDNTQNAEDGERLKYLASLHPNITLLHMEKKTHPAECANAGLKQATGKTVVFLQSDDAIANDLMDLAILASAKENENAFAFLLADFQTDVMPGMKFVESCFEEGIAFDETAIFYNRDYLLSKNICFRSGQVEWENDFCIRALNSALTRVYFAPSIARAKKQKEIYLMRPISCSAAYDILETASRETGWSNEALHGLYAWVEKKCHNLWLPLYFFLDKEQAGLTPAPLILQSFIKLAADRLKSRLANPDKRTNI